MSRQEFLKRLRKGWDLQLEVGKQFLADSFIVRVHPYQETGSDDYDILVKPTDKARWREIEVKGNGKFFTDVEDFPYKNVFVETKRRWDKRTTPPVYYVIKSYKSEGVLCIHHGTHPHWTSIRTKDTQKNIYDDFLTCPKEYCETWEQMLTKLRGVVR